MMDAKQHLYYALGILAYAVAKVDGQVQKAEQHAIHDIVVRESGHSIDFGYVEIIFRLLQKDETGFNRVYEWAMRNFDKGRQHFTPEMRDTFTKVIIAVAKAFPPTTAEEQALIDRFEADSAPLVTG